VPTPTSTAGPAHAVSTLVLQNGLNRYHGVADSHIDSRLPAANFDADRNLKVSGDGSIVALLRFDLSPLPESTQIVQATLELYVDSSAGTIVLAAFEVTRPWKAKEVNRHEARRGIWWGKAGCDDTSLDRVGTPACTQVFAGGKGWRSMDITEIARRWVADENNHGLVLRGEEATGGFFGFLSSEHSSAQGRPKLTVRYLH
jgi:hypothetical protein